MEIRLANDAEAIARCYPVMAQLRPHLAREEFAAQVRRQQQAGYHLAYLQDGGAVRTVAGFRVGENLTDGLHLYVDDLVTDAQARSGGHGAAMLAWLADFARERGCGTLDLDSGVQRGRAHRFYFSRGFAISSYHFRLGLA